VPFVILSTWCFMRAAEVRRTRWADINLDPAQARVEIDPRKRGTASYRVVTLPECARVELEAWRAKHRPADATTVHFSTKDFLQVKQTAGLLEVARERKRKAVSRVVNSLWQPNILRHTGISYFYQKTGDIREVCRQAGHSSDTAFKHYLHLPKPGEAEEFYATASSTA
jgi:integrase